MIESALLQPALQASVEEVLEKMFFVRELINDAGDPAANAADQTGLAAYLEFEGRPSGALLLNISRAASRSMAADFLGACEDDLSMSQVEEVTCELANIICGSVLSRLESDAPFRLAPPRIIACQSNPAATPENSHGFTLANGHLAVQLSFQRS